MLNISFEAITSDSGKDTLCNLPKERNKFLDAWLLLAVMSWTAWIQEIQLQK